VSVIVPVHNRARFLRRTLLSLLADTGINSEILVVDDGSDDGSLETILDLPVRTFRFPENRGIAAARNLGIQESRGRYLTFFDSDDLLSSGALTWRARWLDDNSHAPVVGGLIESRIDDQEEPIEVVTAAESPSLLSLRFFQQGGVVCLGVWRFLFRRTLVEEVGPFATDLKIANDVDYLLRVLARTEIPVLPHPVLKYRYHGTNVSARLENGRVTAPPRVLAESFLVNFSYGIVPHTAP
jgi:glycosyltransferase involved in cell wall biosynthesis